MICDFLSGGNGSLVKGCSTSVVSDPGELIRPTRVDYRPDAASMPEDNLDFRY